MKQLPESGQAQPVCDAPAQPLQLEDGKHYRDRWGKVVCIGGTTRDYPALVWTIGGDWYERATGRFVRGWGKDGQPALRPLDCWSTLAEQVQP